MVAIGDIDNDGELDAIVGTNDGPAYVLLNQTETPNHWVILNLVRVKSNRVAIGAEVRLSTLDGDRFATVPTSSSYQCSNDRQSHFGLGVPTTFARSRSVGPAAFVRYCAIRTWTES
jgi:enediyne biosynthesis protein E4